mmetsp:Transcript_48706/g.72308  ORF Transcript_48706/g.72308 Transcript_48706/m.72308 type:complete len:520 (-) Transcript_48706:123-1682(-)|eukprot:CAMPEP_0195508918 /NCGR_PEP_ID=MMETSP0794_2-20130614/2008_1 /TAXON_ID=515487 /ORGANISM="Stephanopyxis turris, Strain CCMP 815" /LENGTH=519 /DNA_ID=CAMNT_0040636015 /DNA_START=241 /DNA_END=1800 /DNA_ORIENTATION=+
MFRSLVGLNVLLLLVHTASASSSSSSSSSGSGGGSGPPPYSNPYQKPSEYPQQPPPASYSRRGQQRQTPPPPRDDPKRGNNDASRKTSGPPGGAYGDENMGDEEEEWRRRDGRRPLPPSSEDGKGRYPQQPSSFDSSYGRENDRRSSLDSYYQSSSSSPREFRDDDASSSMPNRTPPSNGMRRIPNDDPSKPPPRPIHYQFQRNDDEYDDNDDFSKNRKRPPPISQYQSPRRDVITQYISKNKKLNRLKITASTAALGYATGAILGQSALAKPHPFGIGFATIFLLSSLTRGDYGECSRALGMALILALSRTSNIRRTYPTFVHIKAMLRMRERTPFPPILMEDNDDNPWAYKPIYEEDVEFQMLQSLIIMVLVGSVCGGNLPLVPKWMGALGGAAFGAFVTTRRDAKGDLARTMGMKVVSLVEEIIVINSEISLFSKISTVGGKVFDKIMVLDRQHKIKEKVVAAFSYIMGKISRVASQVQADMQDTDGKGGGGGGGERDWGGSRRDYDRDDGDRDRR